MKTTLNKIREHDPGGDGWKDYSIPVDKMKTLSIGNIKPNYNMTFHNGEKQVGGLDFNGPKMVFTGDADESAKVFFDFIARSFKARLDQERADERNSWPSEMEAMERQVNILTDALAQAKADEREKWAQVCDEIDKDSQSQWPKRLATMIRSGKTP